MPTRTVELPQHLDRFIEDSVRSGRGNDASEMVCEGLGLLERQEREDGAKLEQLQRMVKDGLDAVERGEFTRLRTSGEIEDYVSALVARRQLTLK